MLDEAEGDGLAEKEPLLAALAAASIQGQVATGPRAGHRVRRVLADPIEGLRSGPLCFSARRFSLHAATRIEAENRAGLERLCRYVARPPLAAGRQQQVDPCPQRRIEELQKATGIAIASISIGELLSGFKAGSREKENRAELAQFLDSPRVRLYCIDEETAEFYADILNRLKPPVSPSPPTMSG